MGVYEQILAGGQSPRRFRWVAMDPRALGGLRLVQGQLGQRAAWTKREVRVPRRMQDTAQRKRVSNQLQRERARDVPGLPTYARVSLIPQPRRDVAQSTRRPPGRRSLRRHP